MLFAIRSLCLVLALVCGMIPAQAAWKVAETERFRIYSDGSEEGLVRYARKLERFDGLLRTMTGVAHGRSMPPLSIYLVDSSAALRALIDTAKPVDGYYGATPMGTGVFSVRGGNSAIAQRVLFHEYTHHFMMFHFPHVYPAWYVEGFAEYFQTAEVEKDEMTLGLFDPNRAAWLAHARWIDAERLFLGNPWKLNDDDRARFDAQSWLATHYLLRNPERARRLSAYLARLRAGDTPGDAFSPAFEMDMEAFGKQLRDYLTGKEISYTRLRLQGLAEPDITVRSLPPAADRLLLPYVALEAASAYSTTFRGKLLREIRHDCARYPGDTYAARMLAGAEAQFGNADDARTLLAPLLAQQPDDAELNYLMGRALLSDAGKASDPLLTRTKAQDYFARAYKARPLHYQTLLFYSFAHPDPKREDVRGVLERARELAPQVSMISLRLAEILVDAGEFDRAGIVLRTMRNSPHNPPSPKVAEFVEAVRQHAKQDVPSPEAAR